MTTLKASLVPAVLDALVEFAGQAAAAAPTGDDSNPWRVWDGPESGEDLPRNCLIVGYTGQPDTQSVESELVNNGASAKREVIDVHCMATASSGKPGQKGTRDRVFALIDAFAAAIRADHTLGGITNRAAFSAVSVEPYVGDGAGTTVMFTVHAEGAR